MRHSGTKVIETSRLILRPFVLEDASFMFANWASDPDVTRYMTWPTHESPDISRLVIADWVSHYGESDYYQWAIVHKQLHQPIGSIAVVRSDDRAGKVEIGYCIGKNWWHRGITTEALGAIIEYFLREVGANRVEAGHDPNNPHSGAVMAKCGMQYEGTHRKSAVSNQGICDVCWYAILAEDTAKE